MGRAMLGATNPLDSNPGTIRGDFCIDVGRYVQRFFNLNLKPAKQYVCHIKFYDYPALQVL